LREEIKTTIFIISGSLKVNVGGVYLHKNIERFSCLDIYNSLNGI